MVKKYNDDDPIKDLGDFTDGWTYDDEEGDDEGKIDFVRPEQVVKYIIENIHKAGIYQFTLKGKKYECRISATYTELID